MLAAVVTLTGVVFIPNGLATLGAFDPKTNGLAAGALVTVVFGAKTVEGLVDFAVAPNENTGDCPKVVEFVVVDGALLVLGVPNEINGVLVCKADACVAGLPKLNVTGAEVVVCGTFEALVCAVFICALIKLFEPNVGGVNVGNAVLLAGFDNPNEKLGGAVAFVAGCVSPGFVADSCMTGLVSCNVTDDVDDGVPENANPPRRGTEALVEVGIDGIELVVADEKLNVTLREDGVFDAALESDVALCEVVAVGKGMLGGDDIADTVMSGVTLSALLALSALSLTVCGTSFGSIVGTFDGSVVLGLAAEAAAIIVDGTFKSEVVVAVLNVTEVIVLRLADVEETVSSGFSTWPDLSMSLESLLTQSTSSLGSSPRKKLNIMASFDSLSRFRNMLVVLVFGFTNDIEFSSSSSANFLLLLDDFTLL